MKTIVITGCSWGCGEWNHGDIAHCGLAEYLTQDGYNVVNLSEPNSGPIHLINPLNRFLEYNSHLDIEHIFLIQSDIGRNFITRAGTGNNRPQHDDIEVVWNDQLTLEHNIKGIYRQFYSRLNVIGKYRKKSFNLIGGLSDLVIDRANDFENLNFLIPSWQSLLNPEHTTTYLDQIGLEYLDKHFQNKQEIVPFIDNFLKMRDFFIGNKEFFWPDGMHPNRLGHQVLCDAIKTELNL